MSRRLNGARIAKFHLARRLKNLCISIEEACFKTGIGERQMKELICLTEISLTGQRRIEFSTLNSLCSLGIKLDDLITFEEDFNLEDIARTCDGRVTVIVGGRPAIIVRSHDLDRRLPVVAEGTIRDIVDRWDVDSLNAIFEGIPRAKLKILQSPLDEVTRHQETTGEYDEVLKRGKSIAIGLGSPLVSTFADDFLAKLNEDFEIPFSFVWNFTGNVDWPWHQYVNPKEEQGIRWKGDLVAVPSYDDVLNMAEGDTFHDACVVAFRKIGETHIFAVMGFLGTATRAGCEFIFSEEFGAKLSEYHTLLDDYRDKYEKERKDKYFTADRLWNSPPALCMLLTVKVEKTDDEGNRGIDPQRVNDELQVKICDKLLTPPKFQGDKPLLQ